MSQEESFSIEAMRHSTAHLMAAAIEQLYPGAKFGVGPVVPHGFYYDVETSPAITNLDLPKIEKRMRKIQQQGHDYVRKEMPVDEAIRYFEAQGQDYKVSLLKDLQEKGTTSLKEEDVLTLDPGAKDKTSVYETGAFVDLCRGPHVANTKSIGAYKLTKVSGAYWRGDEKNPMLTRVYGIAFATKEELDVHVQQLEEAKKRDHRKLGQELDLFVFSDLVGQGLPLWTPSGTLLRTLLDGYVRELRQARGYAQVEIPHLAKGELYRTSGHWDKFENELFHVTTREGHEFVMKPMNCPHHAQIYARKPWSYRELPQRYENTTMMYRDEQTGELLGLSRVRAISIDDAHVFCRYTQIAEEAERIWDIISEFYETIGFTLEARLSLHDPAHPEKYLGTAEIWQDAEATLRALVQKKGEVAVEMPGEAAFYGPKIDFMGLDSLGREWQLATIQIDMNQPERFDLTCKNEKGEDERIVMVHAAIMGSIERFLSVIIEHYAGKFPVWLSPVQLVVIPVAESHHIQAQELVTKLTANGVRVQIDEASESVGYKIRKTAKRKVPYALVLGDKEVPAGGAWADDTTLSVRVLGQEDLLTISLRDFVEKVKKQIETRRD